MAYHAVIVQRVTWIFTSLYGKCMKVGINDLSVKIKEMCMLALKKIFFFGFNNILGKRLAKNIHMCPYVH